MTTVFTVGHSNKPLADFINLLQAAGLAHIVDIRSRPQSRFNPWFNRKSLELELPAQGIGYTWLGNQLGGLDGNIDYPGGIARVMELAASLNTAVMCSEGPTAKCHRNYMLTPDLQQAGAEVRHLLWTGELVTAPTLVRDTPSLDALF